MRSLTTQTEPGSCAARSSCASWKVHSAPLAAEASWAEAGRSWLNTMHHTRPPSAARAASKAGAGPGAPLSSRLCWRQSSPKKGGGDPAARAVSFSPTRRVTAKSSSSVTSPFKRYSAAPNDIPFCASEKSA